MEKIKSFIKNNYKWIIFLICIISLLVLIEDVMDADIASFDERIYGFISKYLISDFMNPIMKFITNFANMYWLICIALVLLAVIKNKKIGLLISLNLGLSAVINFTLKQILQRPRPVDYRIIDESGYSLPSGHSMVSMAFYGFIIYLIYKNVKNKKIKTCLMILFSFLIFSIGISRVYLGVHYASDVIAGFLVALAYLIIFVHLIKIYNPNDSSDFVLVNDEIPDAIMDIRYYSENNFIGKRIDGYEEPVALLTKEAVAALKNACVEFRKSGYCIKVFDAYRPKKAVNHFINWSNDLEDISMKNDFYPELDKSVLFSKGYITKKSSHSRGSTIDLTLVDINTKKEVDMGGTFDYFGERSHIDFKDLTNEQFKNRLFLRDIMISNGFVPLREEWWHFTFKKEPFSNTYFEFPVNSKIIKK